MTDAVRMAVVCSALWLVGADARVTATSDAAHRGPSSGSRKQLWSVRVDRPPVVDGLVDDEAWSMAAALDDFHQVLPQAFAEPSQLTEVRLLHDADNLYVGARLWDTEVERIVASQLIQGGELFADDRFFLILDTFNDRRNAFFFSLNGNGVRREALIAGQTFNDDWDAIWEGKARVGETGITMELAIPFKSLSFNPASDTWGINFGRIIPRNNEEIYWSSQGQQDFLDSPAYGGEVRGLTGLEQGLGLDIVPSLVGTSLDSLDGDSTDFEPAIDLFHRPSARLTAALTLNTDFSATEVDSRQINTDRFSLFFPEKRDFFLQDAGIFEFGGLNRNGRPFFSRRIGLDEEGRPTQIRWGTKITGRSGRFNYGVLDVEQDGFDGAESENMFVGRVSVNLLAESSIGAIVTHGDAQAEQDNTLFGADFRYRRSDLFDNKVLEGDLWLQRTSSTDLEGRDLAFGGTLSYPNDRWFAELSFNEIQENFNPALGFVNRTGIREIMPRVRYRIRPQDGPIRTINSWIYYERFTDTDDRLQTSRLFLFGSLEGQGGDWLTYQYLRRREVLGEPFDLFDRLRVPAGEFDWQEYRLWLETSSHRRLALKGNLITGGFFDGDRTQAGLEIAWRPSRHLFLSLRHDQGDFTLSSGRFLTRQSTIRLNLAFSSTLSWSNLVQFDNVSDSVGLNSRFRWNPRAGRELFLVVNQGWDVDLDNSLTSVATQVTSKVGYTLRF